MEPSSHARPSPDAVMTLAGLADGLRALGEKVEIRGDGEQSITGICQDSRRVRADDLFVAVVGSSTDGARFIEDAERSGAAAVMCRSDVDSLGLAALIVEEPGRLAGAAASLSLGEPSLRLQLVGVTGTNGKTSCTYIIESIWRAAGLSAGVVGTISERCDAFERPASITTPGATDLQASLAEMLGAGCKAVAIEVSSHALTQHRVGGCRFDAGIFTNLTRDHLDYHGDEQSYFDSKAALFRDYLAPAGGIAVLNQDDQRIAGLSRELTQCDVWTYSSHPGTQARVVAAGVVYALTETRLDLRIDGQAISVRSRLLGAPNVSNMVAAAACCAAMGIEPRAIEAGLAACAPVPGRLESVGPGAPTVIVDYAHTPDALERVLGTLRPLTLGRLIVVFGCGGDRDTGKRPMMGRAAGEGSDISIITSDNPRTEDPGAIISAIESGVVDLRRAATADVLSAVNARGYIVEPDRRRAIAVALEIASPDDVVVVAGKGHEDYQDILGVKHPFDDREVVAGLLGNV